MEGERRGKCMDKIKRAALDLAAPFFTETRP